MKPANDLSVIIVSYNTCEMLRECLLALPAATAGLTSEVWVVDNDSPDDSAGMVAREFPQIHLIANKDNPGFARANNQAIRRSVSRHVLLLNPDTEARPGSLTRLVRYLDDQPEVGAVGPKLLNTDGSLQRNGRRFPTVVRELIVTLGLGGAWGTRFERAEFMRADFDTGFDTVCSVDQVSGACLLMRGEALAKIGPLDEEFFMFYEETEWCWRLKRAGYRVDYVGDAEVVHHWMGSVRQLGRASAARFRQSARIYYRKTGGTTAVLTISCVMAFAYLRTEILHFGAGIKRRLRQWGRASNTDSLR